MRFSFNFVKKFLNVETSPEELAAILTMAGMEVESLEKQGSDWIFDIEVTTNRYDWLSIIGITREISACLHKSCKIQLAKIVKTPRLKERKVII